MSKVHVPSALKRLRGLPVQVEAADFGASTKTVYSGVLHSPGTNWNCHWRLTDVAGRLTKIAFETWQVRKLTGTRLEIVLPQPKKEQHKT